MVQHNAFRAGGYQGFRQNICQTTAYGDGVHVGGEYVDMLGVFLNPADIHHRAGEDDVYTVFFGSGIRCLRQVKDIITVQVGLGADLEKGRFDLASFHGAKPLFPLYFLLLL
jgi:hypothetical protein